MGLSRDMLNPPYPIHLRYLICHITLVRMVQNDSKCCYSAPCTAVLPSEKNSVPKLLSFCCKQHQVNFSLTTHIDIRPSQLRTAGASTRH